MDQVIRSDRVNKAINFVKSQVMLTIHQAPEMFIMQNADNFDTISRINFTPAETPDEKYERLDLINKYKNAPIDHISHYLLYHMCDEFAIFYWTVLHDQGIQATIVRQTLPFEHTFVVVGDMAMDKLLTYCGVPYPHLLGDYKKYTTPHDLFEDNYISKQNRQPWEVELLIELKQME